MLLLKFSGLLNFFHAVFLNQKLVLVALPQTPSRVVRALLDSVC